MSINTLMIQPQNFSIPAGYDSVVTFSVEPASVPTLQGTSIWWRVYTQHFGIRDVGSPPIIQKASPAEIEILDSPIGFTVRLMTADSINLLRNYYHEATILDATQEMIGFSFGIMTVTATENRP